MTNEYVNNVLTFTAIIVIFMLDIIISALIGEIVFSLWMAMITVLISILLLVYIIREGE